MDNRNSTLPMNPECLNSSALVDEFNNCAAVRARTLCSLTNSTPFMSYAPYSYPPIIPNFSVNGVCHSNQRFPVMSSFGNLNLVPNNNTLNKSVNNTQVQKIPNPYQLVNPNGNKNYNTQQPSHLANLMTETNYLTENHDNGQNVKKCNRLNESNASSLYVKENENVENIDEPYQPTNLDGSKCSSNVVYVPTVIKNTQPTEIHINPHFKNIILINPHFKKKSSIHVNPQVFQQKVLELEQRRQRESVAANLNNYQPAYDDSSYVNNYLNQPQYPVQQSATFNNNWNKKTYTRPVNSYPRYYYPKVFTKYKFDKRIISSSNRSLIKTKIVNILFSDVRKKVFNRKQCKKINLINQFRNVQLMNIRGRKYTSTRTKLVSIDPPYPASKLTVEETSSLPVSNRLHQHILLKKKQEVIRKKIVKASKKLLKKNNVPCPVYQRYGQCRRKEANRCQFLHNPDQIFLCKKFLRGACVDSNCPMSHNVSYKKVPTCKFYLEGFCFKDNCPYLHVKISPTAKICRNFLQGYCQKAENCDRRHQFLCPTYEETGKCPKRKCLYPHENKDSQFKAKKQGIKKKSEKREERPSDYKRYFEYDTMIDPSEIIHIAIGSKTDGPNYNNLAMFIPL